MKHKNAAPTGVSQYSTKDVVAPENKLEVAAQTPEPAVEKQKDDVVEAVVSGEEPPKKTKKVKTESSETSDDKSADDK